MKDVKVFAQIILAALVTIVVGWFLLSFFAASASAQEKPSRPAPSQKAPETKEPEGKQGDQASHLTELQIREIVSDQVRQDLDARFGHLRPLRDLAPLPLPVGNAKGKRGRGK